MLQFDVVSEISLDIKFAYPSKSKEMIEFDSSVKKYRKEVPNLQRTLYPKGCS